MENMHRAAILLLGMGETKAAKVLRYMDPKQVEKIVSTMSAMGKVSKAEIQEALDDFQDVSANQTSIGVDSAQYIRNALVDALGPEKAENLIDRALEGSSGDGLENLSWQDASAITSLIRDDHPQIIAVILTYLDSEKAANVLDSLPDETRRDVMRRIATVGAVSPIALKELNKTLDESVKEIKSFKTFSSGGAKLAANIINFMGSDAEKVFLKDIESFDLKLYEKIQEFIFPFEKLAEIDQRSLQTLLRSASSDALVLSLKGVDQKLCDKFLENMSERAAAMIKDDLEAQGPVQLSKVMEAQKEIVATAQKMAVSGEIVLVSKDDEMVG